MHCLKVLTRISLESPASFPSAPKILLSFLQRGYPIDRPAAVAAGGGVGPQSEAENADGSPGWKGAADGPPRGADPATGQAPDQPEPAVLGVTVPGIGARHPYAVAGHGDSNKTRGA